MSGKKTTRTIELTIDRREFFIQIHHAAVLRCADCGGPVFVGEPGQVPDEFSALETLTLGAKKDETISQKEKADHV